MFVRKLSSEEMLLLNERNGRSLKELGLLSVDLAGVSRVRRVVDVSRQKSLEDF